MSILIEIDEKEKGDCPHRLYLCDSYEEALSLKDNGNPVIPVYTDNNRDITFDGFPIVLEKYEELEYKDYLRLWQRLCKLPWTIAETKRLIIREFTAMDALGLYHLYSYEDNASIVTEDLSSIEKCLLFLQEYSTRMYPFWNYGSYAVINRATGELIGEAGFNNREGLSSLELGFALLPKYRKKGLAYEACKACISYAINELEIYDFHAIAASDNMASIRLLERLGFVEKDGIYWFHLDQNGPLTPSPGAKI